MTGLHYRPVCRIRRARRGFFSYRRATGLAPTALPGFVAARKTVRFLPNHNPYRCRGQIMSRDSVRTFEDLQRPIVALGAVVEIPASTCGVTTVRLLHWENLAFFRPRPNLSRSSAGRVSRGFPEPRRIASTSSPSTIPHPSLARAIQESSAAVSAIIFTLCAPAEIELSTMSASAVSRL